MQLKNPLATGVTSALAAALLFGASTPLAKLLLDQTGPWLLAALLYLGSGLGLWLVRRLRRAPAVRLQPGDGPWLAGAIIAGGIVAPVLLMLGLTRLPAAGVSLLLNAEGVLTALLAWFAFKENVDRRIALGMAAIVAGSLVLSWPGAAAASQGLDGWWPSLAVLGACLAWALDNNLTRKVSLNDAGFIAMSKGLAAGASNLLLAVLAGAQWPGLATVLSAALLGFVCYGASLVLFVLALRQLGTARTGAYFAIAPFAGALLAIVLLDESFGAQLGLAALLMAVGVALHLTERHEHEHRHEATEHEHEHLHAVGELHHRHEHAEAVPEGTRHSHWHSHEPLKHGHAHFPDAHHRHEH